MTDERVGIVEGRRPRWVVGHGVADYTHGERESQADRVGNTTMATETRRGPEPPDISERGGVKNGQPQRSDDRLFMQLVAFGGCADSAALAGALSRRPDSMRSSTRTSTIRAASPC